MRINLTVTVFHAEIYQPVTPKFAISVWKINTNKAVSFIGQQSIKLLLQLYSQSSLWRCRYIKMSVGRWREKAIYGVFLFFLQPPNCGSNRLRRQASTDDTNVDNEGTPATIEVYSGLYVNEANDLAKVGLDDDSVYSEKVCALYDRNPKKNHQKPQKQLIRRL